MGDGRPRNIVRPFIRQGVYIVSRFRLDYEKLDRIPVHRLFDEYLSKGKVKDMKLRFVGDTEKEIIVSTQNGRQFITNCNWNNFQILLAEFEEKYNIHPDERRAGKDMDVIENYSTTWGEGQLTSYTDYKAKIEGQLIYLGIEFLFFAFMLFGKNNNPKRFAFFGFRFFDKTGQARNLLRYLHFWQKMDHIDTF